MKRYIKRIIVAIFSLLVSCQTVDRSPAKYESNVVKVVGYHDENDLSDFIAYIDATSSSIIQKYNPYYSRKVIITLYSSANALHSAQGRTGAPQWSVGGATKEGNIRMVHPYKSAVHSYDNMKKILVHEYTHVIINSINMNVPSWLNEGIAIVEAGQHRSKKEIEQLKTEAIQYRLPIFYEIDKDHSTGLVYKYAGSIVEFIIHDYSLEHLRGFIKNPSVEKIFGLSKDQFQLKWREYILSDAYL